MTVCAGGVVGVLGFVEPFFFVVTPLALSVVVVVVFFATVVVVEPTVVVVVGEGADAKHVGTLMVLASSVTAPLRASTRPWRVAPVLSVAEVKARMVPTKLLEVPKVAELPTCQNTLQACAPFSSTTVLPDAVISVDPAWKMKTASALPPPFSVSDPVKAMADDDW